MSDNPILIVLMIPLALALFATIWTVTCFLIARMNGWNHLATLYSANAGEFQGRKWYLQSGRMRGWGRYKGALTLGANDRGLYLAVVLPFRPGHPPLFIPWESIDIRQPHAGWDIEFAFRQFPGLFLTVPRQRGLDLAGTAQRPIAVPTSP
jgi:hypothetical protein